jgi:hypothetical protein
MPALVFPETPTEGQLFPEVNPRWKYVSNRWTPYSVSVFDGGTIGQVWTKGADNTQAWDFVSGGGSAPGTPDAPTLVEATTTTLEVEVDAVSGATGYKWYLDTVFVASSSSPTYTFTGLTENTEYDITVSATNAYGESAQSTALVESTDAASSYLLSDNLEYADTTAATAGGWTTTGTPTWGYATSPAPLEGSRSLRITNNSSSVVKSFSATGEIWAYFIVHIEASSGNAGFFRILNSSDESIFRLLRLDTNNALRIYNGSVTVTTDSLMDEAATRHIWIRYVKGTGSNGVSEVYVSTTATKPGSPTLTVTNGNATTDAVKVQFDNASVFIGVIWDKLRISASSIGSDPT